MPRRGSIAKRDVLPDPMYNSKLVTRLINNIMYDGKKGVAQKIVYDAFEIVAEKTGKDALEVFEQAMENVMPSLEVKARRVGGANYQVPIEVRPERRQTLGLRWMTNYSRLRSEKTMKERLAAEILDAVNGAGGAAKKRRNKMTGKRPSAATKLRTPLNVNGPRWSMPRLCATKAVPQISAVSVKSSAPLNRFKSIVPPSLWKLMRRAPRPEKALPAAPRNEAARLLPPRCRASGSSSSCTG